MAWRVLLIQNPAKLTIENGQLALENDEGHFTLPLEDIIAVIMETQQAILSSCFLSKCQAQDVIVVTCDESHMPNGVLLPFLTHSRVAMIAQLQQTWSAPLRKRLWQRIVQTKIVNQATCLDLVRGKGKSERLKALSKRVSSGDPGNIEAQAAREYWPLLFGKNFRRGHSDLLNAALNYGYAVVRAHVARAQVVYGLIPAFGLHHNNDLNAFNLTDDAMEVLRPFVDRIVCFMAEHNMLPQEADCLSKEARQKLASIGQTLCWIDGQTYTLAHACEKIAAALVDSIKKKDAAALICPEFAPKDSCPEDP